MNIYSLLCIFFLLWNVKGDGRQNLKGSVLKMNKMDGDLYCQALKYKPYSTFVSHRETADC